MISSALQTVEAGGDLSMSDMAEVVGRIMDGQVEEPVIARFLTALHRKGETVDEVSGAALAMRRRMTPIHSTRPNLIDTCGTGGDGSKTFNISTAAALVVAAAGVPVAKHGNRAATSRSGSADVLAQLGLRLEADVARVESCLDELGICFCFAPLLHTAMRHVAPVRQKLGVPTVFNLLGPLANPASAPFQLLGVGRSELQPLLAESLLRLGTRRALVVHGSDGLDEVTLGGPTDVIEVTDGHRRSFRWQPADFGLPTASRDMMVVHGPAESAEVIRGILTGCGGPARDIVVANAAAALWTAGRVAELAEGVSLACEAIDTGAAQELLVRLVERTREP
ncbi:MAG: anthranilate phosphoribosyltransferase [Planctomycetaceae bacterium]|nr:anthranilate phosphoribosyltransferase [Planctomycetaceae bacterium]